MKALGWNKGETWREKKWEEIDKDNIESLLNKYEHILLFKEIDNRFNVIHINKNVSKETLNMFLEKEIKNRYQEKNQIKTNFLFLIEVEKVNKLIDNFVTNIDLEKDINSTLGFLLFSYKTAKEAGEFSERGQYQEINREYMVLGVVDDNDISFYVLTDEGGDEYIKIYEENPIREFKRDWEKKLAGLMITILKKQGRL